MSQVGGAENFNSLAMNYELLLPAFTQKISEDVE